jgi:hypothetical protein
VKIPVAEGMLTKRDASDWSNAKTTGMLTAERTTATEGPQERTGKSRDANSMDGSISGNTIKKRMLTIAGTLATQGQPQKQGHQHQMSEMLETQVAESTSATAGLAATESLLPELQGCQSTAIDDKSWDPTRKVLLPWIQMPCPGLEPVSV